MSDWELQEQIAEEIAYELERALRSIRGQVKAYSAQGLSRSEFTGVVDSLLERINCYLEYGEETGDRWVSIPIYCSHTYTGGAEFPVGLLELVLDEGMRVEQADMALLALDEIKEAIIEAAVAGRG